MSIFRGPPPPGAAASVSAPKTAAKVPMTQNSPLQTNGTPPTSPGLPRPAPQRFGAQPSAQAHGDSPQTGLSQQPHVSSPNFPKRPASVSTNTVPSRPTVVAQPPQQSALNGSANNALPGPLKVPVVAAKAPPTTQPKFGSGAPTPSGAQPKQSGLVASASAPKISSSVGGLSSPPPQRSPSVPSVSGKLPPSVAPEVHSTAPITASSAKVPISTALSVDKYTAAPTQNSPQPPPTQGAFYKRPALFTPPRLEQQPPAVPEKPNNPPLSPVQMRTSSSQTSIPSSTASAPTVGLRQSASLQPTKPGINAASPDRKPVLNRFSGVTSPLNPPSSPRDSLSSSDPIIRPPVSSAAAQPKSPASPRLSSSSPALPTAGPPPRPVQQSQSNPTILVSNGPKSAGPSMAPSQVPGSPKLPFRRPIAVSVAVPSSAPPAVPPKPAATPSDIVAPAASASHASPSTNIVDSVVSPRNQGVGIGEALGGYSVGMRADDVAAAAASSRSSPRPTGMTAWAKSTNIGNALSGTADTRTTRPSVTEAENSRIASNAVAASVAGITSAVSPDTAEPVRYIQTSAAAARIGSPALRPRSGVRQLQRPPLPKNTYRFHKLLSRTNAEAERQPRPLRELEAEDDSILMPIYSSTAANIALANLEITESYIPDLAADDDEETMRRARADSEKPPSLEFLEDSDDETDSLTLGTSSDEVSDEPLEQWIEVLTDDGYIYYHNAKSGRSTWDEPFGFKPSLDGPQRAESGSFARFSMIQRRNSQNTVAAGAASDDEVEDDDDDTSYGPAEFPDFSQSFSRHFTQKNLIMQRNVERVVDLSERPLANALPKPQGADLNENDDNGDQEDGNDLGTDEETQTETETDMAASFVSDMESTFGNDSYVSENKVFVVEEIVDVGKPLQPEPIREIRQPKPRAFIPLDEYIALQQQQQQSNSGATAPLSSSMTILSPRAQTDPDLEYLKHLEIGLVGFPGQLIKPGRKLVKEGDLTKSPRKLTGRWKSHVVYLLSDILIIAMRKGAHRFKVKLAVPLDELTVKIPGLRGASSFDVLTPIEKVCLMAKSLEETAAWHQAIAETIDKMTPGS